MQEERSVANGTPKRESSGPVAGGENEDSRGLVKNYGVKVRRGRSASVNLDFQGFEDPDENFVQLVNSVPPLLPPSQQFDVRIYCDGACEPNPGNAGSGIVVYRAGKLAQLWFGLYNPMGTNNTAEPNALYHALHMAEAEIKVGNTVEVCSDSAYSINCIRSWAPNWEKKAGKNLAAKSETWKLSRTVTQSTDALKKT